MYTVHRYRTLIIAEVESLVKWTRLTTEHMKDYPTRAKLSSREKLEENKELVFSLSDFKTLIGLDIER